MSVYASLTITVPDNSALGKMLQQYAQHNRYVELIRVDENGVTFDSVFLVSLKVALGLPITERDMASVGEWNQSIVKSITLRKISD